MKESWFRCPLPPGWAEVGAAAELAACVGVVGDLGGVFGGVGDFGEEGDLGLELCFEEDLVEEG